MHRSARPLADNLSKGEENGDMVVPRLSMAESDSDSSLYCKFSDLIRRVNGLGESALEVRSKRAGEMAGPADAAAKIMGRANARHNIQGLTTSQLDVGITP